jgi:hypothetical protein
MARLGWRDITGRAEGRARARFVCRDNGTL